MCIICPPGTVHNPPLLKKPNLTRHLRNAHRDAAIPEEFLIGLGLLRCDTCAGVFTRASLKNHKCRPDRKQIDLTLDDVPRQTPQLPPNGPILEPPPNDIDWSWGAPNSSSPTANYKFSWLFVPLIRCALGLDDDGGLAARLAGDRWQSWVDSYSADFKARDIDSSSLNFHNGYIDGDTQERLLLGPFVGGQSNVPDAIEGSMTQFAVNTLNVYGVAAQPISRRPRPPSSSAAVIDQPADPLAPVDSSRLTSKQLATHRRLYSSIPHGLEDAWIAYARPAFINLIASQEQDDTRARGKAIDSILTLPARGLVRFRGGHKRRNKRLRAHLQNLPRRDSVYDAPLPEKAQEVSTDKWKAKLKRAAQLAHEGTVPHLRRAVSVLTQSGMAELTPENIAILAEKK